MSLEPGLSNTSFYLNGELIDTVMLNYEAQKAGGSGAKGHRRINAVAKLRMLANEVFSGYGCPYGEEVIKSWLKDCR